MVVMLDYRSTLTGVCLAGPQRTVHRLDLKSHIKSDAGNIEVGERYIFCERKRCVDFEYTKQTRATQINMFSILVAIPNAERACKHTKHTFTRPKAVSFVRPPGKPVVGVSDALHNMSGV